MARPCAGAHPLSPETCRVCWWCLDRSSKGRAYRQLWSEPEPPGSGRVAASIVGAVVSHASSGLAKASDEEKARRLALCLACPEVVVDGMGEPRSCRACGCRLRIKASWASQTCPRGAW